MATVLDLVGTSTFEFETYNITVSMSIGGSIDGLIFRKCAKNQCNYPQNCKHSPQFVHANRKKSINFTCTPLLWKGQQTTTEVITLT